MNLFKLFASVGLGLSFTFSNFISGAAQANSIPTITYDMVGKEGASEGVLESPDFSSITFRTLGSFSGSGHIPNSYDNYVGYNLGRQWQAGDLIIDTLKLGDIDDSFGVSRFSLGEITTLSGRSLDDITLSQFGFIRKQTLGDFLKANPQLKDKPIKDVPLLADLFQLVYGTLDYVTSEQSASSLIWQSDLPGQNNKKNNPKLIAQTKSKTAKISISEIEMGNLDLNEYTLGDVEGIEDSFIEDYENWQDEHLSEVEALNDISWSRFPNPVATTLAFVSRVDTIWGDAHGQIKRGHSVSGSNVSGYAIPCNTQCAHLELDDIENSGRDTRWISEGRRWMLGNDPKNANICPDAPWGVDGGEGVLGNLNCGKEPTGRNSFGPGFKVALWSVDETTDTAETAIFFRFCYRGFPDLGCTPYFIGPIPFIPANRESWIILGPGV